MHQSQREMFEWSRATAIQSMSRDAQPGVSHPWPMMDLVDVTTHDELSGLWWVAGAIDWQTYPYWTEPSQLPHQIKVALTATAHSTPRWRFATPKNRGQILFAPDPNIRIVFDPAWKATGVIVAELGCVHTFSAVRRSNCYQEDRCDKCGYHWAVDSSD